MGARGLEDYAPKLEGELRRRAREAAICFGGHGASKGSEGSYDELGLSCNGVVVVRLK